MFLTREGVDILVRDEGQGAPPLLFVHGWMMSHEVWREQFAAFSKVHRTVALDLRGFGASGKPEGDYSIDTFCNDLDFVTSSLALEKPVVVGWSMGASVALVYAATRPERVSKLVLVDGTPLLVATSDFPHGIPPEAAQQFVAQLQADFFQAARGFVEPMFPEPGTDHLKDWIHGITQQTKPSIAIGCLISAGTQDLRPHLGNVRAPTLVCYGEEDRVCLPEASRYMADRIPQAEVVSFPGKGHAPFLTDTQAFNDALRAFLQR